MTESDNLAAALDAAAARWPGVSRGQLVVRLALEGDRLSRDRQAQERDRRRRLLTRAGREFAGTHARAELERMRDHDWPE